MTAKVVQRGVVKQGWCVPDCLQGMVHILQKLAFQPLGAMSDCRSYEQQDIRKQGAVVRVHREWGT